MKPDLQDGISQQGYTERKKKEGKRKGNIKMQKERS